MAEPRYVDWDGLVYYDGKIKSYIAEKSETYIKMGGIVTFAELPDPSVKNLNYIYKITDKFITNGDFVINGVECSENTWVQCTEFNNVFLYTIFNETQQDVDLSAVYNYIDSSLNDVSTELSDITNSVESVVEEISQVNRSLEEVTNDVKSVNNTLNSFGSIVTHDADEFALSSELHSVSSSLNTLISEFENLSTDVASIKTTYATKDELNQAIASIPSPDLSDYYNKSEIDNSIQELKTSILGDGVEEAYDTLKEVQEFLKSDDQRTSDIITSVNRKAEDIQFEEDFLVTTPIGAFQSGESLKGMTLKSILMKILGAVESVDVVEKVVTDKLPIFTGTKEGDSDPQEFNIISIASPAKDSNNQDIVGFYSNEDGSEAGYQIVISDMTDGNPATVAIPEYVTIKNVYQWDVLQQKWTLQNMDYFFISKQVNIEVGGVNTLYNIYEWDEVEYDGVIYDLSNWRFEMEVHDVKN